MTTTIAVGGQIALDWPALKGRGGPEQLLGRPGRKRERRLRRWGQLMQPRGSRP
jgi:hypothetical protein